MSTKKILVLGPGQSINNYKKEIHHLVVAGTTEVFAWSNTTKFLIEQLNILPTYMSFLDWHSIYESLKLIINADQKLKTTLFLFNPVLTKDYDNQLKYIGTSQGLDSTEDKKTKFKPEDYYKCLDLLRVAQQYIKIRKVPTTSLKYLVNDPHSRASTDYQSELWLSSAQAVIQNVEYQCECKLHCALLPLLHYLNWDAEYYLLGFEGVGNRYMHKKPRNVNLSRISQVRKQFMPKWLKTDLNVYSLLDSPNNYFPLRSIEKLCHIS